MPRLGQVGALAAAALVACSGFGSDEPLAAPSADAGLETSTTADVDADVDADAPADAGSPPVEACDLAAPFEAPTELDIAGEGTTFVPTFMPDETTIYYDSTSVPDAPAGARIWRAQRARRDTPFGPPTEVSALNVGNTGRLSLSGDGLTLVFFSDKQPAGLLVATRESPTVEFAGSSPPSLRSVHGATQLGALTHDGRSLYYVQGGADGGMFVSERSGNDFPPGTPVVGLSNKDHPPHVTRDGLTAYFTRTAIDSNVDIYRATRAPDGMLGPPVREGSTINTVADEILAFVSWDGCRLYFIRRTSSTSATLLVVAKPSR